MTTTKKTESSTADAIAILTADHKKVKKLFKAFEKMKEDGDPSDKEQLVAEICAELTLHAEAEEEIFYPAVRAGIDEEELLDEAEVEHATAKDLIAQLEAGDPSDPLYDAKVKVLSEYIDHHVKEEEEEMFPKAKKAKLDMDTLGEEIQMFKDSRQSQPPKAKAKPSRSART
ncbi:MAG: hemerythrin domain-containing protein [Pseudomonadota bacterium]